MTLLLGPAKRVYMMAIEWMAVNGCTGAQAKWARTHHKRGDMEAYASALRGMTSIDAVLLVAHLSGRTPADVALDVVRQPVLEPGEELV